MKNRDVFADEILQVASELQLIAVMRDGSVSPCIDNLCKDCIFSRGKQGCVLQIEEGYFNKWLNQQYNPDEYIDWSKVEVDTPILVRDFEGTSWMRRHFAKYEDGNIYTYKDGKTSWSSSWSSSNDKDIVVWKYGKLARRR